MVTDPPAQRRVLGPALRHVAVAVRLLVRRQPGELRLPGCILSFTDKVQRLQPRRPRRRDPRAGVAAVQLLLAHPLVVDPPAQRRVLGPALRHVAVAVRLLVRRQPGKLRLPGRLAGSTP